MPACVFINEYKCRSAVEPKLMECFRVPLWLVVLIFLTRVYVLGMSLNYIQQSQGSEERGTTQLLLFLVVIRCSTSCLRHGIIKVVTEMLLKYHCSQIPNKAPMASETLQLFSRFEGRENRAGTAQTILSVTIFIEQVGQQTKKQKPTPTLAPSYFVVIPVVEIGKETTGICQRCQGKSSALTVHKFGHREMVVFHRYTLQVLTMPRTLRQRYILPNNI